MSKPVLRRLGVMLREIVVIVAGASLALAADALYERRQDRAERARILRSLDADLRADSAAYARFAAGRLDQRAQAASTLLAVVEDRARSVDRVELARLVRESIAFPSGVKESATYREITATGGIGFDRPAGAAGGAAPVLCHVLLLRILTEDVRVLHCRPQRTV